ncbi:hypothetical protein NLJ89_g12302 [Agrocybe chaxingu]|uniref:Uncharacterized protein n=1 Tax=Agrocybe chaxingu TaxID=84603 RepID=A0A9W8JMK0_9AGAR|nr:hypothetical protein NLJ89_g12302 [Agrocybe chaxingu]
MSTGLSQLRTSLYQEDEEHQHNDRDDGTPERFIPPAHLRLAAEPEEGWPKVAGMTSITIRQNVDKGHLYLYDEYVDNTPDDITAALCYLAYDTATHDSSLKVNKIMALLMEIFANDQLHVAAPVYIKNGWQELPPTYPFIITGFTMEQAKQFASGAFFGNGEIGLFAHTYGPFISDYLFSLGNIGGPLNHTMNVRAANIVKTSLRNNPALLAFLADNRDPYSDPPAEDSLNAFIDSIEATGVTLDHRGTNDTTTAYNIYGRSPTNNPYLFHELLELLKVQDYSRTFYGNATVRPPLSCNLCKGGAPPNRPM